MNIRDSFTRMTRWEQLVCALITGSWLLAPLGIKTIGYAPTIFAMLGVLTFGVVVVLAQTVHAALKPPTNQKLNPTNE